MKIFLFIIIIFISGFCFAQNTAKEVVTKYNRISLAPVIVQPSTELNKEMVTTFSNYKLPEKMDDLNLGVPFIPLKTDSILVSPIDSALKMQIIKNFLEKFSSQAVAKWFNRDKNGKFNMEYIYKAAINNARSSEIINACKTFRGPDQIKDLGDLLIGYTHFVVFDDFVIRDYKDIYREDSLKSLNSPLHKKNVLNGIPELSGINQFNIPKVKNAKDLDRKEGYVCTYKAYVFRLAFNGSVASDFYGNYWMDSTNYSIERAAKFDTATFPVEFVQICSKQVKSFQLASQTGILKKSMEELLHDLPQKVLNDLISSLTKEDENFKVREGIFQLYPIEAKLGSKEGLYPEQRFFVSELSTKNGTNKKKHIGTIRVGRKVGNNNVITDNFIPSTKFYQVGGKKLYAGAMLEESNDLGLKIGAGITRASVSTYQGINAMLEANLSQLIGRTLKKQGLSIPTSINFGVSFNYNMGNKIQTGDIGTDFSNLTNTFTTYKISILNTLYFFSKDAYFTKKGNIYFSPFLGYGNSTITFTNFKSDSYIWKNRITQLGIGVGLNVRYNVALIAKPSLLIAGPYKTKSKSALLQNSSADLDDKGFGFKNIDQNNFVFPMFLGLRITI